MKINIVYENNIAKRFLFNDNLYFLVYENTEDNSFIIDAMQELQKISFNNRLRSNMTTMEEKQKDDFINFVNFLIAYAKDKGFQKVIMSPSSLLGLYITECKENLKTLGFTFPRSRYSDIEKILTT